MTLLKRKHRHKPSASTMMLVALVTTLLNACAGIERLAIPDAQLIDTELASVGYQAEPDHRAWDMFLKRYLVIDSEGLGRLAYADVSEQDKVALDDYIALLSGLDATLWSRNAQLAYWVNLYNATTVAVILDHYPVKSIRDIKSGLLDLGPWEEKRLLVNGRLLSLHDIEHGVVRAIWSDTPEIHYLLNCAAVGCPTLVGYAYTADNISAALGVNARAFTNSPRGVSVTDSNRLVLSKIYAWYLDDYGGSTATTVEHLLQYADPDTRMILEASRGPVRYVYDWSLNDAI